MASPAVEAMSDTAIVFGRYFRRSIANPIFMGVSLVQPVLYLALFAPLLTSLGGFPGAPRGHAYAWFVPGLLIQLGLFSVTSGGWALIAEMHSGVLERMRVTPASRVGLLLGRTLRDVATLVIQALIIVLISVPLGLAAAVPGMLVGFVLVALIGLLMASVSYAVAFRIPDENTFGAVVFSATLPLLLLSGVLLPMSLAPRWLQGLADVNPLLYAVDAERSLFAGQIGNASVAKGFAIVGGLTVVAVAAAVRGFRRAAA
jgi:ABC-2 type transport system permease protein